MLETEATDLISENDRDVGIQASTKDGPLEIRATLVIAADGRRSTLRDRAGLEVIDIGAPIDVLWMRLSKHAGDPQEAFGNIGMGGFAGALVRRAVTDRLLASVQRRRELPAPITRAGQISTQERFLSPVLASQAAMRAPSGMYLSKCIPWLRRIPAYNVGIGFRPGHVRRLRKESRRRLRWKNNAFA